MGNLLQSPICGRLRLRTPQKNPYTNLRQIQVVMETYRICRIGPYWGGMSLAKRRETWRNVAMIPGRCSRDSAHIQKSHLICLDPTMLLRIYAYACIYIYIHLYIHTCVYIYMCVYMYIYAYIYIYSVAWVYGITQNKAIYIGDSFPYQALVTIVLRR